MGHTVGKRSDVQHHGGNPNTCTEELTDTHFAMMTHRLVAKIQAPSEYIPMTLGGARLERERQM